MSDIKLFRLQAGKAVELQGDASDLEKPLQTLIEANLDTLLGIRFLATEYSTCKTHAGRIDSLGLDENNCPVLAPILQIADGRALGLSLLKAVPNRTASHDTKLVARFGADRVRQGHHHPAARFEHKRHVQDAVPALSVLSCTAGDL